MITTESMARPPPRRKAGATSLGIGSGFYRDEAESRLGRQGTNSGAADMNRLRKRESFQTCLSTEIAGAVVWGRRCDQLWHEDGGARGVAAFQVQMSLRSLSQPVGLVDVDLENARVHQPEEVTRRSQQVAAFAHVDE